MGSIWSSIKKKKKKMCNPVFIIIIIITTVLYSSFRVISLFLARKVKACNALLLLLFLTLPEFTFQRDSVTGMISWAVSPQAVSELTLFTLPAGTKPRVSHHRSPGRREAWKEEAPDDLPLKGRETAVVSQTNIGTDSKSTLGKLLREGVERVWAFPSAWILCWTEQNWTDEIWIM